MAKNLAPSSRKWRKKNQIGENGDERKINPSANPAFSLLFLCASRKTHRHTVSASAVNLLRQKRKKRTLAETLSQPR